MTDDEKRAVAHQLIDDALDDPDTSRREFAVTDSRGFVWLVVVDPAVALCLAPERARAVADALLLAADDAEKDRRRASTFVIVAGEPE
ncbi:MAG TPA: hypothetical protein VK607_10590 [Kofleriaceae bacterium]|nr:hypothetical protein [Kofleriaceae bacterium]